MDHQGLSDTEQRRRSAGRTPQIDDGGTRRIASGGRLLVAHDASDALDLGGETLAREPPDAESRPAREPTTRRATAAAFDSNAMSSTSTDTTTP
jgi:hypothetical protein